MTIYVFMTIHVVLMMKHFTMEIAMYGNYELLTANKNQLPVEPVTIIVVPCLLFAAAMATLILPKTQNIKVINICFVITLAP